MNAKTMISLLSLLPADTEIVFLMLPERPLPGEQDAEAFDEYEYELASECEPLSGDVVLAGIEGFPAWLVARQAG